MVRLDNDNQNWPMLNFTQPAGMVLLTFTTGVLVFVGLLLSSSKSKDLPTLALSEPISLPLIFFPSSGQPADAPAFEAAGQQGALLFEEMGVQLALAEGALAVNWIGANGDMQISGTNPQSGVVNIYRGSDRAQWQENLPTFSAVSYSNLYPGIDLVYDGSEGLLKGTYHVGPGADPSLISWQYVGAEGTALQADGDLTIRLKEGVDLSETAPFAYQLVGGERQLVDASYRLAGERIGFTLGAYDSTLPLIIDPTLVYSSYLGGKSDDAAAGVAVDKSGAVYVTGDTYSSNFPGGADSIANAGYNDIFITRINEEGTTVSYTTILGGSGSDEPRGVAVNPDGSKAWITGMTTSDNLPTMAAFQDASGGGVDGFVMQFNNSGKLALSSYLGAQNYDSGEAIALDTNGNAHIAGDLEGGFFAKVNGQTYDLEYVRMVEGEQAVGYGIALDGQNNIYIAGQINSDTWPTVKPVQAKCGKYDNYSCSDDAFVVKLNPAGDDLVFSTYLGGSASNGGSGADTGSAIAVNANGDIAVAGKTYASDFPVVQAAQGNKPGIETMSAAFVTRIVRQGSGYQIGFSTYLAGSATDWATGVAMNNAGQVYAVGGTNSDNLPVANAWQPKLGPGICFGSTSRNCYDAFIAQFGTDGKLLFSTYFGGTDDDIATGTTVDREDNFIVVGQTDSIPFPTTEGSFQPNRGMIEEAFVLKGGTGDGTNLPYRVNLPFIKR